MWSEDKALDRNSHVPLFAQIKQVLLAEIRSGHYEPGKALASEPDLAVRFGVSRMTVRQAISELAYDGLLERIHGKGTFVREQRPLKRLLSNAAVIGLFDALASQGKEMISEVRGTGVAPAEGVVARNLEIPPGAPVVRIVRLRFVDAVPVALQSSYLPQDLVPGLEREDLSRGSLLARLRQRYGLTMPYARQTISARNAIAQEAHLLHGRPGDALLYVEKVTYTAERRPVEYVQIVFAPDRYQLYIEHDESPGVGSNPAGE